MLMKCELVVKIEPKIPPVGLEQGEASIGCKP